MKPETAAVGPGPQPEALVRDKTAAGQVRAISAQPTLSHLPPMIMSTGVQGPQILCQATSTHSPTAGLLEESQLEPFCVLDLARKLCV